MESDKIISEEWIQDIRTSNRISGSDPFGVGRMKSIISNERRCYVCGTRSNLHKHHCIYGAGRRPLSEEYGLWVYLCGRHHNLSNEGVHFNKTLDEKIKRDSQAAFESLHSHDEFMRIFGRNYL